MIDPMWLVAGAQLMNTVGGFMGQGGQMTEGQRRDERFMNDFNWKQSLRNEKFQHDLAKHGIRWRTEDAQAAGLHPLAALGVNPASGGFGGTVFNQTPAGRSSMGEKIQNMGQSIDRVASATATREERAAKMLALDKMRMENERLKLDNFMAKTEAASRLRASGTNSNGTPDAFNAPLMGQGNSPVQVVPTKLGATMPGEPGREAGVGPGTMYFRTQGGGLAPARSRQVTEALEDDFIGTGLWNLRTYGARPLEGPGKEPDPKYHPLPKGYDSWMWIPHLFEYRPVNSKLTGIKNFLKGGYYYDERRK